MSDAEPPDLDEGIRQLSRLVVKDETLETTLQRIVEVAESTIPGVFGVSITLRKGKGFFTAAATGPRAFKIDQQEYAVDQGPCIDALDTGELQRLDDLATEERWPRFRQVCADEGVASTIGVPLTAGGLTFGAMNLYAASADTFGDAATSSAVRLAEQAAVALANATAYADVDQKARQLQEALDSRVVIEQAKGILMATDRIDGPTAFARLKERSQRSNKKLRLIAEEIVASLGSDRSS